MMFSRPTLGNNYTLFFTPPIISQSESVCWIVCIYSFTFFLQQISSTNFIENDCLWHLFEQSPSRFSNVRHFCWLSDDLWWLGTCQSASMIQFDNFKNSFLSLQNFDEQNHQGDRLQLPIWHREALLVSVSMISCRTLYGPGCRNQTI